MGELKYKVIETSSVTAEDLETLLNEWDQKGFILDQCLFAMRDSSRRPSMAFLVFIDRNYSIPTEEEKKKES